MAVDLEECKARAESTRAKVENLLAERSVLVELAENRKAENINLQEINLHLKNENDRIFEENRSLRRSQRLWKSVCAVGIPAGIVGGVLVGARFGR